MPKVVQQVHCDTLPAAKIAVPDLTSLAVQRPPSPAVPYEVPTEISGKKGEVMAMTARKLCVRHQRIADGETSLQLQQVLVHSNVSSTHILTLAHAVSRCTTIRRQRSGECDLDELLFLVAP